MWCSKVDSFAVGTTPKSKERRELGILRTVQLLRHEKTRPKQNTVPSVDPVWTQSTYQKEKVTAGQESQALNKLKDEE